MKTKIIGDVHGKHEAYCKTIKNSDCTHSVQVGDMGFQYDTLKVAKTKHKFFGGNHDNYDIYYDEPRALGDYGKAKVGALDFFFIRGGFSIDVKARLQHLELYGVKSWWEEEQLDVGHMIKALQEYKKDKPKIMLSHSCPHEVSAYIGNPDVLKAFGFNPKTFSTHTQELLQKCFDEHKPDVWIFGHFHRTLDFDYQGTRFMCLGELRHVDYEDGEFINNNKLDKVSQR